MSQHKIIDECEQCEQKELCPVYMGHSCQLVHNHMEELRPTPIPSEEEVEYSVSRG